MGKCELVPFDHAVEIYRLGQGVRGREQGRISS